MQRESRTAPAASRRISLTRPGSKGAGNTKRLQKEPSERRVLVLPWTGIGKFFLLLFGGVTACALLAAISFGLVYGYRQVTTSEYFQLQHVKILGNSRLDSREIQEIADLGRGTNALALSIDDIEDTLVKNPWVSEVSVKRILPDTLEIRIVEKNPAFWVQHQGILHYADMEGRLIAPVTSGQFASLPTLEIEAGAEDATAALPDLLRSLRESRLPVNTAAVSWVRLSAARGVEVFIEDTRLKLSIGLEDWLPNLQRLGRTLADLKRRGELEGIREIRAHGAHVWVEKAQAGGNG